MVNPSRVDLEKSQGGGATVFCTVTFPPKHSSTRETQEPVVTRGQLRGPQLLSLSLEPVLVDFRSPVPTVAWCRLHNHLLSQQAGVSFHSSS